MTFKRLTLVAAATFMLTGCPGDSGSGSDATSGDTASAPETSGAQASPEVGNDGQRKNDTPANRDDGTQDVIFVGNNWEGTIDVISANNYQKVGRINGIPDKKERLREIFLNPDQLVLFKGIRHLIGEGNDQYVDDMYSVDNGRLLVVSRPSFADVVGINIATGAIEWRFEVDGYRSDHMAISPDGDEVAVSASTGDVVHILDAQTGEEVGQFPSGDSPHENVYSKDGERIYHASIGQVFTPMDRGALTDLKGERVFQIVDAGTYEILERFDFKNKLENAGYGELSPAIRPMAHTSDERFFYFQVSFFHGFVEYDMENGEVTRVANLPKLTDQPREKYVNDSAHHGISMSGDDKTLCVAGTMDDYAALVDRETFDYKLLEGLGTKPYWVTTNETGTHCYISWSGTDRMSVISIEKREEVASVEVGDHPQRVREGEVPAGWSGSMR
ncbi:serine/threonine protein kinase [uncultured Halovibrio sp.]|uniref:YncE family protein n=1 Tax=uncultured Halovibrio sp. TaxID=985049 RepID=UPI0025F897CF|nr:serine/threonine protein kinase [uncultured Halovibrio sp.]